MVSKQVKGLMNLANTEILRPILPKIMSSGVDKFALEGGKLHPVLSKRLLYPTDFPPLFFSGSAMVDLPKFSQSLHRPQSQTQMASQQTRSQRLLWSVDLVEFPSKICLFLTNKYLGWFGKKNIGLNSISML